MACPHLSRRFLDHALPRSSTYAIYSSGTLLLPVNCLIAQIQFAQWVPVFTSTQNCSAKSGWRSSNKLDLPIFARSQNSQPSLLQFCSAHGLRSCRNALSFPWWCWWTLWPQGRSDYTQSWTSHGRIRWEERSLLMNFHFVTKTTDDLIQEKPSALVPQVRSIPLSSLPWDCQCPLVRYCSRVIYHRASPQTLNLVMYHGSVCSCYTLTFWKLCALLEATQVWKHPSIFQCREDCGFCTRMLHWTLTW